MLECYLSVLSDLLVLAIVASATHLKHTKTLQPTVLYSKSLSAVAIVVHFLTLKSGAGSFICHSCGTKGKDIIAFLERRYQLTFKEAIEKLINEWRM